MTGAAADGPRAAARQLAGRHRRSRAAGRPGVPRRRSTRRSRPTRMDLAKWVVSPDNPLTARVFVNRLWKVAFGQGLVRNLDDFGTQGTPPTHPELLDWLATEFVRTGWDVKGMLKLMVMSNAYRQSSVGAEGGARHATRRTSGWPGRTASGSTPSSSATTPWPWPACSRPRSAGRAPSRTSRPGYWAYAELPAARVAGGQERGPVPPRAVHVLVPQLPAPEPGGVRRPEPRGMHQRAPAVEHADPGPRRGVAPRADLPSQPSAGCPCRSPGSRRASQQALRSTWPCWGSDRDRLPQRAGDRLEGGLDHVVAVATRPRCARATSASRSTPKRGRTPRPAPRRSLRCRAAAGRPPRP